MIFHSDFSVWFLLIIIPVAIATGIFFYRNSKLSNGKKYFLISLRSIVVFLLLFLLLTPVITIIVDSKVKPLNIVLIDNSLSMKIENRDSVQKSILENIFSKFSEGSDIRYFIFSKGISSEFELGKDTYIRYDSIDNFNTDYKKTLNDLNNYNPGGSIRSVIFITDGLANAGGNPTFTNIPLTSYFYYLIGDTIQKKDLSIKNIIHNKYSYIQTTNTIRVIINSYLLDNNIRINLYEDGAVRDSKIISVSNREQEYYIDFKVSSAAEGIKKYKIEIENQNGEITYKNNTEEFFIKYYPNKFKILFISGSPSADLAFISSQLETVNNFEIKYFTMKSSTEFYQGGSPDFSGINCVILFGFPTNQTSDEILRKVKNEVELNKLPVFFVASSNMDYNRLLTFEKNLPFTSAQGISSFETNLNIVKNIAPVFSEKFKSLETISSFPSVYINKGLVFSPESQVILTSSSGLDAVLTIRNGNDGKSAFLNAFNLYKWRLNNGNYDYNKIITSLFSEVVLELTDYEKNKKLLVETTQPVFSEFEKVKFIGEINNKNAGENSMVYVKILSDNYEKSLELNKKSGGTFEGEISIENRGDYKFIAELYIDNNLQESVDGRFIIGENNFEFKQTRANDEILKSLSAIENGGNLTNLSKSEIQEILKERILIKTEKTKSFENIYLRNNWFLLILIIIMLSLEWFFRKRFYLP